MQNPFRTHKPGKPTKIIAIIAVVLIVGLFWQTKHVAALPIFTADGTNCTLEDAITSINTGAGFGTCVGEYVATADEINLTYSPTYTVSPDGITALPAITVPMTIHGNNNTISRDAGAATTFRVMLINGAGDLTLNDVTIANGVSGQGGGIRVDTTLTANNITVTNNQAAGGGNDGGGIFIDSDATATINDSTFTNNTATDTGAAIRNSGTLIVDNTTFTGNTATTSGGAINQVSLGGIATDSTITNSTFTNNTSGNGGAISINTGPMNITNTTFSNNQATLGGNDGGAIFVDTNASAIIDDSTFNNNSANDLGGAIRNDGALTLDNTTFTSNSANTSGGAIQQNNAAATTTITNSTFTSNTAGGDGGAIQNGSGQMNITDTTFSNNSAIGGDGGAIYNFTGTMDILRGTFTGNTGDLGGAIRNDNALTIDESLFNNNTGRLGGAVDSNAAGADATITNTTFSSNDATQRGGGIYVGNGAVTVSTSTFNGNTATITGGAIHNGINAANTLNISNSTVSGNNAPAGASIFQEFGAGTATNLTITANSGGGLAVTGGAMTITNSIIANQQGGGDDCDATNQPTSGDYNLESGTTCGFAAANDLQNTDPLLGGLANNGGPTQTHALQAGSPAIDFANAAVCAAAPVNGVDQRGEPRGVDLANDPGEPGGNCDIGAYERQIPTPSSSSSSSEEEPVWELTIVGSGVLVDPNTVDWTFTVCNVGGTNLPGVWPLFLFQPAPASALLAPDANVDYDESKVNLGPMGRDTCKQVFIRADYDPQSDPLVCVQGTVPGAGDRPCVSLSGNVADQFPSELPTTGGQPVPTFPLKWALILLVALGAAASAIRLVTGSGRVQSAPIKGQEE